jgi:hypothetical protein
MLRMDYPLPESKSETEDPNSKARDSISYSSLWISFFCCIYLPRSKKVSAMDSQEKR